MYKLHVISAWTMVIECKNPLWWHEEKEREWERGERERRGSMMVDNIHFIHECTWLLMQIKALIVLIVCMLSYFKYISTILHNFMLWYKNISIYVLLYIIE